MKNPKTTLALALLLAFPMARAQAPVEAPAAAASGVVPEGSAGYAQQLVDDLARRHPRLLQIDLHAKLPGAERSRIVAAKSASRVGHVSDPDDIEVLHTGQSRVEINRQGDQNVEVELPLLDAGKRAVGSLELTFPYVAGMDEDALQKEAAQYRDELSHRIPDLASLAAPAVAGDIDANRKAAGRPQAIDDYNKPELGNKQNLPMTREVASGSALGQTQDGYSEAIKNVAGVAPTNSAGSSNDAFSIRGIKLNLFSNYRLDGGLPVTGVITNPTENKDRVETLKGANALMFGVASPAGIINFVTKRAGDRDVTSVGLAGNGFGQYGMSADIGRRFGPNRQFGVRFNTSLSHLENGVRDMGGQSEFFSLGLDWRATSRLSFQGDIEYYSRRVPEQAGISLLPAVNGVVPLTPVPDPRQLLSGRWDLYTPKTTNTQWRADYVLAEGWKVFGQAGYSDSHRHRTTVRIGGYNPVTGAGGVVSVQPVTNDYRNTFFRSEVLGHFKSWQVAHDLTIGFSRTERYSATSDVQNITLPQRQNIFDPIVLNEPVYAKPGTSNPSQTSTDSGLYAYDTVGLTQRFKLLLGVRAVQDKEDVGSNSTTNYVTSPAYGVLFDVLPTTTLFASYMEGLEAGGTSPANAANANVTLSPAISKQKEIGIRDSYFKGLSVSASYFDITRGNAVTDPVTNIFAYSGDLEYKGVEATVAWEVTRNWRLNAAVLRLNAKQNSPVQPLIDGKVPENTPKWNGNVGVAYSVTEVPGLTLKAGIKSISNRPLNPQNTGFMPGYSLYDAGVSYATRIQGHRSFFQLVADNLANKRYWNSVGAGTYGIGMDRSVKFNARFDY